MERDPRQFREERSTAIKKKGVERPWTFQPWNKKGVGLVDNLKKRGCEINRRGKEGENSPGICSFLYNRCYRLPLKGKVGVD